MTLLLNYFAGLDLERRDQRGLTALMKAAIRDRSECVVALLMAGVWRHFLLYLPTRHHLAAAAAGEEGVEHRRRPTSRRRGVRSPFHGVRSPAASRDSSWRSQQKSAFLRWGKVWGCGGTFNQNPEF